MTKDNIELFLGVSDRINKIYEGGFKIWDSQFDMIINNILLSGKVLDLGCGLGCLGIYALNSNCSVDFIDFNEQVIDIATIPNAILNECDLSKSRFFSGSWNDMDPLNKYNTIVAADVLYLKSNYPEIIAIIKKHLLIDGTCYIGTKIRYFGLDGDMIDFIDECNKNQIHCSKKLVHSTGIKRYILTLRLISC